MLWLNSSVSSLACFISIRKWHWCICLRWYIRVHSRRWFSLSVSSNSDSVHPISNRIQLIQCFLLATACSQWIRTNIISNRCNKMIIRAFSHTNKKTSDSYVIIQSSRHSQSPCTFKWTHTLIKKTSTFPITLFHNDFQIFSVCSLLNSVSIFLIGGKNILDQKSS